MKDYTKFVGLDVSKDSISVAVADTGRGEPRFLGNIPHTPEAIRKCMRKLGTPEQLHVCCEAGPTGYALFRFLIAGKKAAVAVARELMGFIWAIGCEIESKQSEAVSAA